MFGLRFRDRIEAGQLLGRELAARFVNADDTIVLALPRGGVPVGYEVAKALGAPLDVFIVRKLGVPGHEELAMGAIASGGVRVLNHDVIDYARVTSQQLDVVAAREERELSRREAEYRGNRAPLDVRARTVIVVDDGLATGSTMRAAVEALRAMEPKRVIVAVPVGAAQTCEEFRDIADEIVCLRTPEPFEAVGLWYDDFTQTTDAEVHALLCRNPQ
ncbi:MAG TPA: phosphoribosyltransferase [Thermoanaerobaculia bacterium]|jgi:predicted phosphoribosyltransferase|nr:phosphoribosyltransferase [Thermoanaerobaculia bacterium]